MKILIVAFALSIVGLIWLIRYQGTVISDQETTIRQLMAPMPQITRPPVPAPKGIEPPKRRQLDTPAPTEQNVV
jgi:cytoskeletal protein RodZ